MGVEGARGRIEEFNRPNSRQTLRRTGMVSERRKPSLGEFAAGQSRKCTGWPEYPLVVSGCQIQLWCRSLEQNRLRGSDRNGRRRRSRGSAEKSDRHRQSELSRDLPFFAQTVTSGPRVPFLCGAAPCAQVWNPISEVSQLIPLCVRKPSGKIADQPGIVPALQIGPQGKSPYCFTRIRNDWRAGHTRNDVWTGIRNPKRAIVYDLDSAAKPMAF